MLPITCKKKKIKTSKFSMAKTFVNNADSGVKDYLKGIQDSYPGLTVDIESQIVLCNKNRGNKVAIVSGGGSGHEPFGVGFVADNMLTGCICGAIFASPPSYNIYKGLLHLSQTNKGGILVLILNYSGDRLNFGMAIEKIKQRGVNIDSVVVSDDCSNLIKENKSAEGKRGCSGMTLLAKIIGGMSSEGQSLTVLRKTAEEINARMYTTSVAIEPCTLPGNKEPLWKLKESEMEIGVGIHGEKGIRTVQMASTKEIVKMILENFSKVLKTGADQCYVILINNLGICTEIEMYIIANELKTQITEKWKIILQRFYVGKLMTSLNMKGILVTALNTTNQSVWVTHLDSMTEAFGWPFTSLNVIPGIPLKTIEEADGMKFKENDVKVFKKVLLSVCHALDNNENKLNQLDSGCGDGDCGSCLKRLSWGIKSNIEVWPLDDLSETLFNMSDLANTCMGGTSGALYSLMFIGAASNGKDYVSLWKGSIDLVKQYSTAQLGDRTMLDALIPAYETFRSLATSENVYLHAFNSAVEKAEEGCNKTATMKPRVGRATYVDASIIKDVDAGAYGVVVWLKAIKKALEV